jgi:hypothetical protein
MPTHVSPAEALALSGLDAGGGPKSYSHPDRLAAVWAEAHDTAEGVFGSAPAFFSVRGNALVFALEATPPDASVEDMRKVVADHIEGARPKPAKAKDPAPAP